MFTLLLIIQLIGYVMCVLGSAVLCEPMLFNWHKIANIICWVGLVLFFINPVVIIIVMI